MIRRSIPLRFDRPAESGRTEPLRFTVETNDHIEHEVFVKVSSGKECSVEGLMNEMLGALLAADLGLPINEPFFVELDTDFIQSVVRADLSARLAASCPLAFASKAAGPQWRRWVTSDKIVESQVELALGVIAFDGFIANSDRGPRNPNLLVRDLDWRVIDHESAFGFRTKLFPRCEPWKLGNLELLRRYGEDSEHVFARLLTRRDHLDFAQVRARWSGLSDARFAQYDATLPEEWDAVRPILAEAIGHLKKVRDNIDLCLTELKRVLT